MSGMGDGYRPAETLAQAARQATLEPLELGDPRYVDLSAGQETRDLKLLRQYVDEQSADERRYALATFSGTAGAARPPSCSAWSTIWRLDLRLSTCTPTRRSCRTPTSTTRI